jgi:hypothetical protein
VPPLNDEVLHGLALQNAVDALARGQDPTDPWLAPIALGYPLFHHYQHLPYVLVAILHLPFRGVLESAALLGWSRYLLLGLFPLSIYWSMRRFGFSRLEAALAGMVAPLLATDGLYGFDLSSYVWQGYGLYTQLWGMLLLPPALAQTYSALRTGRGYFWAVLLLAATLLSHLVLGYIAFVSVGLLSLLRALGSGAWTTIRQQVWPRARRLALLLALVGVVSAYFLIPFLLDSPYMNRSVWEDPAKLDGPGHAWTLKALVTGALFDFGRFPSLTLLLGAGLIICLWRWREERYRIPVALFLLWLLLYFGRPTWGMLLDFLPLSRTLHLHRLIGGVHLGGIYLVGISLALPWCWALSQSSLVRVTLVAVATLGLLYPVYRERGHYLDENARWMVESHAALAAEGEDIAVLFETLRQAPPGRVYAGRGANWGADYRVGAIPLYALLNNVAGLDMVGYLYHALSLNADIQVLLDESRPDHFALFNVRYIVVPAGQAPPGFVEPVDSFGRHSLYRLATGGYFDLVDSDVIFAGHRDDFFTAASQWLASDLPRLKQHPAISLDGVVQGAGQVLPLSEAEAVIPLMAAPANSLRGRIVSEGIEAEAYSAEVEVERDSVLMLKATYHPNWRATVDGAPAETLMLMPSYVGVRLAPGRHQVRLAYGPGPLRPALLIAGLLALAVVALAEWLARRRVTAQRKASTGGSSV